MKRLLLLTPMALLAACSPPVETAAVDACILREYLQECESELSTPEEVQACRKKAPLEATRVPAAIPAECRR